ncbi:predicted protein [Chaetoceros tenuissimus]|uniref:Uncharacterized protein n=1 Tax=Chaetoceros tenuissimus TaxID=426638 RepID=A0AAD3CP05_9STRA|nr:predicted protein [Chaetoceros tenuissimus]
MISRGIVVLHLLAVPFFALGEVSVQCSSDLEEIYSFRTKTYQELHKNLTMYSEYENEEGVVFYTLDPEATEDLKEFTSRCERFTKLTSSDAESTSTTVDGTVVKISSDGQCEGSHNVGIPACIPKSCGTDDKEVFEAVSSLLSTPVCSETISPIGADVSSSCIEDVFHEINNQSDDMGNTTKAEICAEKNETILEYSFSCDNEANNTEVVTEAICVPSTCSKFNSVAELINAHIVKMNAPNATETCEWKLVPIDIIDDTIAMGDDMDGELDCSKSTKSGKSGKSGKSPKSSKKSKSQKSCKGSKKSLRGSGAKVESALRFKHFNPLGLE